MSTFSKLASTFVLFLATFGFSNVVGCSAQEEVGTEEDLVGSTEQALTAEQCNYFDVNGSVQICHELGNGKFKILRVNEQACVNAFSSFPNDYVTSTDPNSPLYDPTCQGNGCLPENAPCDATLPCCDGSSCQDGTCQPDAPPPDPCACAGDPLWDAAGTSWTPDQCRFESGFGSVLVAEKANTGTIGANGNHCIAMYYPPGSFEYSEGSTGGKACTDHILSLCGTTCEAVGGTECGAQGCVFLLNNSMNCGACGHACAPGDYCEAGVCVDNPYY